MPLSKKHKFVRDGVFFAELYEYLKRELQEDGFSGIDHRVTPSRTEVVIHATKTKEVLGEKGRRIRELTSCVQKRFKYPAGGIQLYVERVLVRGLSAMAQAENLRFKLVSQLPVRRAAMGIIRNVMDAGAKGCEVIVGGKIRGQRAKIMKFRDGYMLKSGGRVSQFVDIARRHVFMRAGALGVRVSIMLPLEDATQNASRNLPDVVTVLPPKDQ